LGEGLEAWWWIGRRRRRRRRRRGFWHGGSAMGIGVETVVSGCGRVGGCVNSNYVEFVGEPYQPSIPSGKMVNGVVSGLWAI